MVWSSALVLLRETRREKEREKIKEAPNKSKTQAT